MPKQHPRYPGICPGLFSFRDGGVIGYNRDRPDGYVYFVTTECGGYYFTKHQLEELRYVQPTEQTQSVARLRITVEDEDVLIHFQAGHGLRVSYKEFELLQYQVSLGGLDQARIRSYLPRNEQRMIPPAPAVN